MKRRTPRSRRVLVLALALAASGALGACSDGKISPVHGGGGPRVLSIVPSSATVGVGGRLQLDAEPDSASPAWRVKPGGAGGTVAVDPGNALRAYYTAPTLAAGVTEGHDVVVATDPQFDPSTVEAQITVVRASFTVFPPSAYVGVNGHATFVVRSSAAGVRPRWSVKPGGAGGTIEFDPALAMTAIYSAPGSQGHDTVLVFDPDLGLSAEAPVTITTTVVTHGMTLAPDVHPRLWFDASRLEAARAWLAAHPMTLGAPYSAADYLDYALRGLLAGSRADCRVALDYLIAKNADLAGQPSGGGLSDDARWWGDGITIAYDWCYPHLSPAEQVQYVANANNWIERRRVTSWGGVPMSMNNYYWGFLRNQLAWGIASYPENIAAAETFIEDALVTRYTDDFIARDPTNNRGGVAQEGTEYGPMITGYPMVPFVSAELMGRPVYDESTFWKEAVYAAIYSTLPGANSDGVRYFWSHSDTQNGLGGAAVNLDPESFEVFGNFMSTAAWKWPTLGVGRHARQWVTDNGATRNKWVEAVDPGGAGSALAALPLDYWAAGARYLFGKTAWSPAATAFFIQAGDRNMNYAGGHQHVDWGSWQLWRGGRHLSRETTAYGNLIADFAATGTTHAYFGVGHNVLFVEGAAITSDYQPTPTYQATIPRLESRPGYAFVVADLSQTRGSATQANPHFVTWVREFVFVRGLETLVVLDRVEADHAADVRTVLIHSETDPTLLSGRPGATIVNGDQALDVWVLLPATGVTMRKLHEGGDVGQYRIYADTAPNATQSYVLTVLQARGALATPLGPSVSDGGSTFTLRLDASSSITFQKGMTSSLGTITLDGAQSPLSTGVQSMIVTADGPAWQ